MTRQQAAKQAEKRWGKKAIIRASEPLSSPEKREIACAGFDAAKERLEQIDAEIKARLDALDWLQALRAERAEQVKLKQQTLGWRGYYKFSVGQTLYGIAYEVAGQGDTWEEAFAKADAKRADAPRELVSR